jgi:hypothetical protein
MDRLAGGVFLTYNRCMKYSFRKSSYTPARVIDGISITKAGRIGLSKFFVTTQGVQRATKAHLYWDSDNQAIAIDFTRTDDPTAFPIIFTQQYGAFISASRFFRVNSLDPSAYKGRYTYSCQDGEALGIAEAASSVFIVQLPKAE